MRERDQRHPDIGRAGRAVDDAGGGNDLGAELWQPYVMNYHPHPVWTQNYRDVWLDLPRRRVADSTYVSGGAP